METKTNSHPSPWSFHMKARFLFIFFTLFSLIGCGVHDEMSTERNTQIVQTELVQMRFDIKELRSQIVLLENKSRTHESDLLPVSNLAQDYTTNRIAKMRKHLKLREEQYQRWYNKYTLDRTGKKPVTSPPSSTLASN